MNNNEMSESKKENKEIKVVIKEIHSKEYLKRLQETTYKGQEVVFILPGGGEYRNEKRKRN